MARAKSSSTRIRRHGAVRPVGVVGCAPRHEGLHAHRRRRHDRAPLRRSGRQGRGRARGLRRGRRSRERARARLAPRPIADSELHELLVQLQRELFVVGAELATAPENRGKLKPEVSLVTAEMVTRLEPIIDDITGRFEAPKEFVLPGQNRGRRRARLRPHRDPARGTVSRSRRPASGWLGPESQVVPYLNRLADLVYTLVALARRRLPSLAQTVRIPNGPHVQARCQRAQSRPVRRPGVRGRPTRPGRASSSTTRSTASSPSSWRRPTSTASAARCSRCRPADAWVRGPRCCSASATRTRSTRPRCGARARCSPSARRGSRRSRRRCSTRSDPTIDPRARRAGVRRRRVPRPLPVPAVQVGGQAVAAGARVRRRSRANAKVRAGLERGARIAEAVAWARDLVNEPAAAKSPADVVDLARGGRAGVGPEGEGVRGRAARAGAHGRRDRRRQRLRPAAALPAARVRAGRAPRARSRSSARASCSTPAACRSRPRAAWRR